MPMATVLKLARRLFGLFLFCLIHSWVAWNSVALAFGFGEADSWLAIPFVLLALVLVPLFLFGQLLTVVVPDNLAMAITVVSSGVLWWSLLILVLGKLRRRKSMSHNAKSSLADEFQTRKDISAE